MLSLSIIIPAYNEAGAIRAGKLDSVAAWIATQTTPTELIVVDDGSQDETATLATAGLARVIQIAHAGKAYAVMTGIQQSQGDVVLFTDMDQATPIGDAAKLMALAAQGFDVIIGSRGLARPGAPVGRYILSWSQMALRRLLLGLAIQDTQCGFKAFTRTAALDILSHLQVYHPGPPRTIQGPSVTSGFDTEFLFVARQLGYKIEEVPVTWNYQQTRRVHLLRDAWRGTFDLLSILGGRLQGKYSHHTKNYTRTAGSQK